ncbi:putative 2-oxoglutarate dehydrogenase E1 component DHKTD1, mitochondrial [Microbotryomycetes sp. JL221]|nr:putative 2-oxoglutarate dehydrogenase E1 component DHKTD1, mitochondrial [Microbotryomycetes sp. JL221]
MLRTHRITKTLPRPSHQVHRRLLHDDGVWGFHAPRESKGNDFTPAELTNRTNNASLLRLVESYRKHGHRASKLDPLDLASRSNVPALDPRRYGFQLDSQLVRSDFASQTLPDVMNDGQHLETKGILDLPVKQGESTVKSIEYISKWLAEVYCEGVAYEFMHLPAKFERRFLEKTLESSHSKPIPESLQLEQWRLLTSSEVFDAWAAKRFPNVKRYGLEGAEGMMVAISHVLGLANSQGVKDVVIAMPHRGRLNLLTQLLDLDMRILVRKMRGQPTLPASLPEDEFTDDVLSHLFLSTDYTPPSSSSSGSDLTKVHLLPNPSHLEAVSPVGQGFARALQVPFGSLQATEQGQTYELGDKVLNLQVHGDAAFGGQGIVQETLNLSNLPNFTVGGSIRLVVNNQLGYTTPASTGRSSLYASELAKSISAPILHVNGDRIDDVTRAMSLAMAYRNKFKKDVIVDLVVYRRRGHNELDEPSYTSPVMYQAIERLPSVAKIYEQQLISSGLLTTDKAQQYRDEVFTRLDESLTAAEPEKFQVPELTRERGWEKMKWPQKGEWENEVETGVDVALLKEIGQRSVQIPKDIVILLSPSLDQESGIDFATAEALALGSMVTDGRHVRLCGQDSGRGTFSQRHAVISDQTSTRITVPLQTLTTNPLSSSSNSNVKSGTFEIVNSPLSEYAVVGFEQGFAWVSPHILPIWEAQFGDFHNTAQVALDTFLGSAETKWALQSALTLLLPHGYEGAGPEHSSARIERFLQLTNEPMSRNEQFVPNLHLVQPTTASNYFHVLRRQMARDYRKPLVVFSPKGILRLAAATSELSDMAPSTKFQPLLTEHDEPSASLERVVFLSGKIYYDLVKRREELGLQDKVTFVRIEEISPFPYSKIETCLEDVASATGRQLDVIFAQDEPENAGAWSFVSPRLSQVVNQQNGSKLRYVGRKAMATPAPGVGQYFRQTRDEIWTKVFEGL